MSNRLERYLIVVLFILLAIGARLQNQIARQVLILSEKVKELEDCERAHISWSKSISNVVDQHHKEAWEEMHKGDR